MEMGAVCSLTIGTTERKRGHFSDFLTHCWFLIDVLVEAPH